MYQSLASYRHCVERIQANWLPFQAKRNERLQQQLRHGIAAEKVAENILRDLFTAVLDWEVADFNHQVHYADLELSRLGITYLIVEVKRPGALAWNFHAIELALHQALRYAAAQKVDCVGVSDGVMLYVADVRTGGLHDRVFVALDTLAPPLSLFWLSVHGIYRTCEEADSVTIRLRSRSAPIEASAPAPEGLLHHKYKIPANCFAYIGDASKPNTWKLPYCLADGSPDVKRLPKAIQAVLSNYRGTKVSAIPEQAIPDVLVRLAKASAQLERMPHQTGQPAQVYQRLAETLDQLGRLDDVVVRHETAR